MKTPKTLVSLEINLAGKKIHLLQIQDKLRNFLEEILRNGIAQAPVIFCDCFYFRLINYGKTKAV